MARFWKVKVIYNKIFTTMKKIFLSVLIAGLALGVTAQAKKKPVKQNTTPAKVEQTNNKVTVKIASSDSIGNIKFETTSHDFGKIPQGIPATVTFKFVNANPTPVTVNNARPSCGCTAPNWTKEPIASGGTGTITATYNAASAGHFSKTITVETNLGSVVLTISGVVEPTPAEPEPTPIKIGS